MKYVIGLDYGTDSVRALIVNVLNGEEVATHVFYYPRWKKGLYCDPATSQYRQHPLDYLEGLEVTIKQALKKAGKNVAENIVGISVDTTGSTPVAVDENGTPLSMLPDFKDNPNGMFILWKDHTANKEADEINQLAHSWSVDFTKYVGGIYSSEWFWAKILRTLRVDETIREKAYSWVEHCDWISAVLTSENYAQSISNSRKSEISNLKSEITTPLSIKRSRCAAGHKALWHEEFEGLPSEDFLVKLDPLLHGLRDRLFRHTYTSDMPIGKISKAWAKKLGLSENVVIGVGAFDAHMGAVGADIEPYSLVRVMGTSTCDMLIAPNEEVGHLLIKGICGQVDGSILPNMLGMEAGQSAFGDVYAWFQNLIAYPLREFLTEKQAEKLIAQIIPSLSEKAARLPVTENDPIALDWLNGRRTPDANHTLKGAIMGLNLGSDAPKVFKGLVEATAFGAKAIVNRFNTEGVPIKQLIGIGGVSKKSPFVMQTLADVLNMPIKIVKSEQACALGAAMCAATAAGVYPTMQEAQKAMSSGFDAVFYPNKDRVEVYEKLYEKYVKMGSFVENQL
jgi:L-ribulokinase